MVRSNGLTGLVIKTTGYSESSGIITFLTPLGKMQAAAPGSKSLKSATFAGAQPFAYSDIVLEKGRGDLPYLKSCDVIETFYNLRLDVKKLALAVYFADLADLTALGDDTADVLRFLLNTLYILERREDFDVIKPAFELRYFSLLGFLMHTDSCVLCGSKKDICFVSAHDGGVVCENCGRGTFIRQDTLMALRYILSADEQRVFSFEVSGEVLSELTRISSEFVLNQLEFKPKTLSYYENL